MTLPPGLGLRILVALLGAAAVGWLVWQTEWIEVQLPRQLAPEFAADGSLAARRLLEALGQQTRRLDSLETLPPPGTALLLATPHWDLLTGSSERLRAWVEAGGHLVVDNSVLTSRSAAWMLVVPRKLPRGGPYPNHRWCRALEQRADLAPAWGDSRGFNTCLLPDDRLDSSVEPLWALDSAEVGREVLRVPLGRGRITAFGGRFNFDRQQEFWDGDDGSGREPALRNLSNRGLLEGDNAALLAALVDVQRGGGTWFVTRLQQQPLPVWLWQQAAPALLLAAGALLLALWRGSRRFGPLQAAAPPLRRSLADQVRGLADFLGHHQPAALHAAGLRALHEAAAGHVNGWARLPLAAQAEALAHATSLPAPRIAAALGTTAVRPGGWGDDLLLLETARRRLLAAPPSSSASRTR